MTQLDPQQDKLLKVVITALSSDAQGGILVDEGRITDTVRLYAPIAGASLGDQSLAAVIDELTKRFNVWTGKAGLLLGDDPGHEDWLPLRGSQIEWRFWNRYRQLLELQLPPNVVLELHDATDRVLRLLEDPQRKGAWRRQGLIVGHVQSGKTANYTGLICKAADAGYKVIVVLSGIHNSLRTQTQIRLDEGFLGYARPFGGTDPRRVPTGVGLIDSSPIADSVTTRDGDFSKVKAQGFQIHAGGNVLLFVVKKNVSVLKNLIAWAQLSAKKPVAEGRSVVGDAPLLIIDDEADQASIDTKVQAFDEESGEADKEHDPTAINKLIRRLLEVFERRAYVGYTATPFANVFIHPSGSTPTEGEDLFPKHFILNLSAPSDYFGPRRVFADPSLPAPGRAPSRIRHVSDAAEWAPPNHKNTLVPRYDGRSDVPPSLHLAVRAFILACAARRARGQEHAHKSMLVHVTRFTAVQQHVHAQVVSLVENIRTRWRARHVTGADPLSEELRTQWDNDFLPTSQAHNGIVHPWELIEPHVWPVLELLKVSLINAKASDALIYEEHKKTGLHVIAVGGDKLSRGLTLEGLTVSYFLRASRMYDTLMQMGRWFGYRPAYEDLCRLYLSPELDEWYGHITEAADELRAEFDRMVMLGGSPDDYGLRVRTHPVLAISGKLRPGLPTLTTSLSATPFEPTVFHNTSADVAANWEATEAFLTSLGPPSESPVVRLDDGLSERRGRWPGSVMWSAVAGRKVMGYLQAFRFADAKLTRTPSYAVTGYIADRIANDELVDWTVLALGKLQEPSSADELPPLEVTIGGVALKTLYRDPLSTDPFYVVKRVGSPRDESADLTTAEWERVVALREQLAADPQRATDVSRGRLVREARPRSRGLLIIYLLTPPRQDVAIPIVAPYVSFPHSPDAKAISYRLNYRYWEEELGGVE